jgi:hypothetical protein
MFIKSDLEKLSLAALYDLLVCKVEELHTIRKTNGNCKEHSVDIKLLHQVIISKKMSPLSK